MHEFQVIWRPDGKEYTAHIQMIGRKELVGSTLDFHTMKVKSWYNEQEMISGIKFETNHAASAIKLSLPVPNNEPDHAGW